MRRVKNIIIAAVAVFAFALGVSAQQGDAASAAGSKGDSAAPAVRQASQSAAQPLAKQTSVIKPTKKTNWSKIKTLFE